MPLISTENHGIVLQTIKKLLSMKADKSEVATKVDKSEVEEIDAIRLVMETNLIPHDVPIAEDDSIYTDEKGVIYTL